MNFRDPWLLLFLALPAYLLWIEWSRGSRWRVAVPAVAAFRGTGTSWRVHVRRVLPVLRALGLASMVIALARPIGDQSRAPLEGQGIDIALVVDVSGSMKVEDLVAGRTRLDVVKEVVKRFVQGRRGDRMGLIAFARYPITVCPFTVDDVTVAKFVDRLEPVGLTDEDGTAIGVALAHAARRLKKSTARSRVVVLLTDGANNVEDITPEEATRLAASLGIRVYTIMAGRDRATRLLYGPTDRNETKPLVDIARGTGGKFFRAEDAAALAEIYKEIGALEKSRLEESRYNSFTDLFRPFVMSGLGLLLACVVLDHTWLRRLP